MRAWARSSSVAIQCAGPTGNFLSITVHLDETRLSFSLRVRLQFRLGLCVWVLVVLPCTSLLPCVPRSAPALVSRCTQRSFPSGPQGTRYTIDEYQLHLSCTPASTRHRSFSLGVARLGSGCCHLRRAGRGEGHDAGQTYPGRARPQSPPSLHA